MDYTYDGPAASPKDEVRFLTGDTKPRQVVVNGALQAQFLLADQEIAYCLQASNGDVRQAAVLACESIIGGLAQLCDQTVGSVSKSFSQLKDSFAAVLAQLKQRTSFSGGRPILGGTSRIGKLQTYGNPDFIRPQFTAHMMRYRDSYMPAVPEEGGGLVGDDLCG